MAACTRTKGDELVLALLGACLVSLPGCKEKDSGISTMTLEGKIETIERTSDSTGKITVLYYSEKQGQDILGEGLVTNETEIMVNGVVSALKDLREGDRVSGHVRIERRGESRVQTALKISVDRPKPVGGD